MTNDTELQARRLRVLETLSQRSPTSASISVNRMESSQTIIGVGIGVFMDGNVYPSLFISNELPLRTAIQFVESLERTLKGIQHIANHPEKTLAGLSFQVQSRLELLDR